MSERKVLMKRKKSLILSIFFWGSGQFFICKQRLKGLIIFALQLLMISLEVLNGYWIEYFAGYVNGFSIRLHGGFFTKGFWGLVTLGEKAWGKYGDHSTMLVINGMIAIFTLILFIGVYI